MKDSALKARGGETPAVEGVPCTAPQAPCLLKTWCDLFFKSLGWTCKFGGTERDKSLWKGPNSVQRNFCIVEARPLIFDGHFLEAKSSRLGFVRFFISGQEHRVNLTQT